MHQPAETTRKKSSSFRWLLIMTGVGLTGLVGLCVVLYIAYQNDEEAQRMGDFMVKAWKSSFRPEVRALKELGCQTANLLDITDPDDGSVTHVLTCQVQIVKSPPSCDSIAQAYLAGANPRPDTVVVNVQKFKVHCFERFDGLGNSLGAMPTQTP